MSILDWFEKKQKKNKVSQKLNIPGNLWVKCPKCSTVIFKKELEKNFQVCSNCNHHFRLTPEERIKYFCDTKSFIEIENKIEPKDYLKFKDTQTYKKRIQNAIKKTNKKEAIIIGNAKIKQLPINIGIMDFSFMGGSMGSGVGEKITKITECAIKNKNPLIIFTSSGGARMQEGIISLMQMAKTSCALAKLSEEKVPYISILCDPTTGGTSASFAMLGDINIAEPKALISFAGPRVIEQTIKEKLPKGFQSAEFALEHGVLDMIIHRKDLKQTIVTLIKILNNKNE